MKVAIVHDWLTTYAGSEKVLEQMLELFPEADLFSTVDFLSGSERQFLRGKEVHTSFIQKLPLAKKKYRQYLPLMPMAVEQFDLSPYDLILSSSHAVSKGVITGPNQLHISYVHSPIRYAWDLQHQYLKESGLQKGLKGMAAKWMLSKIRMWDYRTSNGVDYFIANSGFISSRIWKVYRRESQVIYPPANVSAFAYQEEKDDFYLTASRMVPYKKMDLIVEAFSKMPDKQLVVIGDGPEMEKVRQRAGSNVQILGYQEDEVLIERMQRAKAFVFAAEEDFGITVVEAQACGTPVIAYGKGGSLETIQGLDSPNPTGVFFEEQSVGSIIAGVQRFEAEGRRISPEQCRRNAMSFTPDAFKRNLKDFIDAKLAVKSASRLRSTDLEIPQVL
ncbi:glycosyltransferase family 4 protein [Paenibacillus sp. F411]|uniref:Alpha-d-mannose-alpha(1-6)phosphatidyl myo-inositol monomannoside transferase n=1 Tax=Paenibacillus algicola TaxID=2565926 RepID=A0A4P8XL92_9BACL|nr:MULTISPECIES: glycosyltransferase family 4 protein [Paenibacillus]MBO2944230.1 glycosyltransferase family 4 protein [Paenibacillus sp. F411]QCT03055.1 alpha-d-mannose-alpha(1-6)phosphatidyl myo-inositol monomannoside transferase [Paenibacillus algicola]